MAGLGLAGGERQRIDASAIIKAAPGVGVRWPQGPRPLGTPNVARHPTMTLKAMASDAPRGVVIAPLLVVVRRLTRAGQVPLAPPLLGPVLRRPAAGHKA